MDTAYGITNQAQSTKKREGARSRTALTVEAGRVIVHHQHLQPRIDPSHRAPRSFNPQPPRRRSTPLHPRAARRSTSPVAIRRMQIHAARSPTPLQASAHRSTLPAAPRAPAAAAPVLPPRLHSPASFALDREVDWGGEDDREGGGGLETGRCVFLCRENGRG